MDRNSMHLSGDQTLIDNIVCEVKSQGVFDQFRRECFSDVDTKPAYQNLRQRVENSVATFLNSQEWKPDLNKNQLREKLRKNITESGFLETGVERIVDQVVNPKINTIFLPKIEDISYKFLGIEKPKSSERMQTNASTDTGNGLLEVNIDFLPNDLEAVSPDSDKSTHKSLNNSTENLNASMGSMKMEAFTDSVEKLDDFESPAFEPLEGRVSSAMSDDDDDNSKLSAISGLTSQDSVESCHSQGVKLEVKKEENTTGGEPTTIKKEEHTEEKPPATIIIQQKFCNDQYNQDSVLSQVSSNSRLSIVTNSDCNKSPGVDISEEAQMPKFNDSSTSNGSSSGAQNQNQKEKKPFMTSFDIKKDEIIFEGTDRRKSMNDMEVDDEKTREISAVVKMESDDEIKDYLEGFVTNGACRADIEEVKSMQEEIKQEVIKEETMQIPKPEEEDKSGTAGEIKKKDEELIVQIENDLLINISQSSAMDVDHPPVVEFKFEEPSIFESISNQSMGDIKKESSSSKYKDSHKSHRSDRERDRDRSSSSRYDKSKKHYSSSSSSSSRHRSSSSSNKHSSSSSRRSDEVKASRDSKSSEHKSIEYKSEDRNKSTDSSSKFEQRDRSLDSSKSEHRDRSLDFSGKSEHCRDRSMDSTGSRPEDKNRSYDSSAKSDFRDLSKLSSSKSSKSHHHHSSSSSHSKDRSRSSSSSHHSDRKRRDDHDRSSSSRSKSYKTDDKRRSEDKRHKDSTTTSNKYKTPDDDHYCHHEKHIEKRRSTDRDSNDGQSNPSLPNSASKDSKSSETTSKSSTSSSPSSTTSSSCNDSQVAAGGSTEVVESNVNDSVLDNEMVMPSMYPPNSTDDGDFVPPPLPVVVDQMLTGNDLNLELIIGQNSIDPVLSTIQQQLAGDCQKIKKPKLASNIFEAKKMMKVRKQIERDEKKRMEKALVMAKQYLSSNSIVASNYDDQGVELEFACINSTSSAAPSISSPMKPKLSPVKIVVPPVQLAPFMLQSQTPINAPLSTEPDFYGFTPESVRAMQLLDNKYCNQFSQSHCKYDETIYFLNCHDDLLRFSRIFPSHDLCNIDKQKGRTILRKSEDTSLMSQFDVRGSSSDVTVQKATEQITGKVDELPNQSPPTTTNTEQKFFCENNQFDGHQLAVKRKFPDNVELQTIAPKKRCNSRSNNNFQVSACIQIDTNPDASTNAAIQASPTPSEQSNGSKENNFIPKIKKAISRSLEHNSCSATLHSDIEIIASATATSTKKATAAGSTVKTNKTRYSSDDLYKPRPILMGSRSRRRGFDND